MDSNAIDYCGRGLTAINLKLFMQVVDTYILYASSGQLMALRGVLC